MSERHYVIIGAGISGITAAETIRKKDPPSRITILCSDCHLPYRRYQLPGYIAGQIPESRLFLHESSYYENKRLKLRPGQTVNRIDLQTKKIYLDHMEVVDYDRLLIASGSEAHFPAYLRQFSGLVHTLRTLDDARALRHEIPDAKNVFIIGGTLATLELLNAILRRKTHVTLLLTREGFWPLSLPEEEYETIVGRLSAKKGLDLILEDDLESVRQEGKELLVKTRKGSTVSSGIIIGSYGYAPDLSFLDPRTIEVDRGILVDEHLRTTAPDVWASGDCAQPYHVGMKCYYVNHGWPNAKTQGRIAGLNMADKPTIYDTLKVHPFDIEGVEVGTPWWKRF